MKRTTFSMLITAACFPALVSSATAATSKHPESYTLSSWRSRVYNKWDFSLVSKTYWYTAGSVAELKQQLSRLPAGIRIGWYSRPEIGFVYPPEPMFNDIKRFLSEHHFELVFMRAPRTKPKGPNQALERTADRLENYESENRK
jgi:hypothetical protein